LVIFILASPAAGGLKYRAPWIRHMALLARRLVLSCLAVVSDVMRV
jgi:hypothetical protein